MGGYLSPPRPSRSDGGLLQLRLHCMDLLQLVFSLHGSGTRLRSQVQRPLLHAALPLDDRLLSCRRSHQRPPDARLWASYRPLRPRLGRAPLYGCLSCPWIESPKSAACRGYSCRRRGSALSLAEFLLVGLRGYCRIQLRRLLEPGQHGRPDWRGGNGVTDALDRTPLWLDDLLWKLGCPCGYWGHLLDDRASGSPPRHVIGRCLCGFPCSASKYVFA